MTSAPKAVASVTRRFKAAPERVFDAWLNPEMAMKWMGVSGELGHPGTMQRVEIDARVGGRFSMVDLRDGEEIDHQGEYLEIDRPRRLVFTWSIPQYSPDADIVTINILPLESGCEVTLTHEMDPQWADYTDRSAKAWGLMLTAISRLLGEND